MKRITLTLLFLFLGIMLFPLKIQAETILEPLEKADGSGYVTYRNQTTQVMIPTEYTQQQTDFRAVWVSPLVGDINSFIDKTVFKSELLGVLNVMESFHMNAIVFHIRIMHDALYDSDLNVKSNYIQAADFEEWDYLEWFIGECHRRGIEFHAWLNPYRITNYQTSLNTILNRFADYPSNPASKEENVIIGSTGAILNPGEPAVRKFLVDTCMEVIEKYDVDAIHFDDYFYASMPYNADYTTYQKYKAYFESTDIYGWRQEQIDTFIQQLSTSMRAYNLANNRQVQLGIAPTGIWKNGNGVVTYDGNGTAITTGSNTAGQEHYSAYLYCNTKKWVDNEWIDYIIPQSYWSFELQAAPYADVVDWWAKVVRYKKVNLYTGMGFYRHYTGDSGGSWETNPYEASNQIRYNTKHPEIKGVCIFNYDYLKIGKSNLGMAKVLDEYWIHPVATPTIQTMSAITPQAVQGLKLHHVEADRYILSWEPVANAKKYLIYRSDTTIDLNDSSQVIGMVGINQNKDCLFSDTIQGDHQYAIVAQSGTGHQSEMSLIHTSQATTEMNFDIGIMDTPTTNSIVFPKTNIQFNFDRAEVFVGSALTYQVYGSYDQENWTLLEGRLRSSGISYSFTFEYPNNLQTMYIKIVGTNEFGSLTSSIAQVTIKVEETSDLLALAQFLIQDYMASLLNPYE
ncbi:MAG: family 10 glycosylhydrolase [Bacilli bacterium]|nr:family 10 glycosylhydrolase [Bacilli bacterium]